MAELWLQTYLRHILLNVLPSPEINLMSRQLHISHHLEMINDGLWAINAVIMDAKLRAIREPELKKWLWDVNTAIMKLQQILEIIQDYCQQQLKQPKQEVTPPSNLLHHDSTSISTLFLCSRRRAILVDLKQIARRVNCLLSRTNAFGLVIDMIDSMNPNQHDYYSILREEVVEREDDINRILQIIFWLQEGQPLSRNNDDRPFVVAISGDSRMGKSILARMIYHHPLVCQFFKHRIWVDVSDCTFFSFAHRLVARECIRHLTGTISSDINIWSLLRMSLPQARYLIVLDGFEDITMAEKEKWEELKKNLLSLSAPGSRVIITCQDYSIIEDDQIIDSDKVYRLHDITQNAKTKIFFKYLISRMQPDHSKQISSSAGITDMPNLANLQEIPFSTPDEARIFGSILGHLKGSYEQLQKEQHLGVKSMIMHNISHSRTQFLRYIVLFRPLPLPFIKDWFDMLITEGTFTYARKSQQEFERNINKLIECYQNEQIFNYIHSEFCKNVHHVWMRGGQKSRIPQRCRYLCMLIESGKFSTNLQAKLPNNLRALILYRERDLQLEKDQAALSINIPKSLVKSLVILRIIGIDIQQLLNKIGTLLHLRYLNISEEEIEELPKSICDLYNLCVLNLSHCKKLRKLPEHIYNLGNLQKLKLDYCTRLQKIPESITRLGNLRVLDVEACYWLSELPKDLRHLETLMNLHMTGCVSLTQMPIGISKLTNLEALSGYIVDDYDHGILTLQELQPLVNIEQLHVQHLERVLNLNAIKSANLKEKQYLENLLLHWEWWNMDVRTDDQLESLQILEALQPNFLYLANLDVISYMGMEFPNWMMAMEQLLLFNYLVEIRFMNIKRCNNLPLLCLLPSLATLEISGMDSLSYVGNNTMTEGMHTFPSLVKLTLSEMPSLTEWNFSCPCLQNLTLIHCPKLMRLVGSEVKIKLTIWLQSTILGQNSTSFRYIFKNIEELEIIGCHELRWLPEDIMHCENLQTISIIRCSRLHSLPNWLEEISSLKKIMVLGCTAISHISEKLKLRFKDQIMIQGCHKGQAITRRDKHVKQ